MTSGFDALPNVDPGRDDPSGIEARLDLLPNLTGFRDEELDDETVKRRVVHGAGATIIAQAIKFVLKFGSAVIIGRLLGPSQFGIIAMVSPFLGFVSTLNDLGFAQAVVQKRDITTHQISGLFWVNLLLSCALATVLMLCAPLIGALYHEPRTVGVTVALAGLVVVATLGLIPSALLNRRLRFLPLVAIEIGTLTLNVCASILFAWLGLGYWALVLGQATSSLVGLCAVWAVARWRPMAPFPRPQIGPLIKFGVNLSGVNLATYFSMTADNMIVGVFAGKVGLGLYDRSYTLVLQPLTQLMAPLGRVAVPLLSRMADQPSRFKTTYYQMLQLANLAVAPAMICCVIMPTSIITFLLGPKWEAAAPVFGWISLGGIFAPIFSTTGWVFITEGRTREQVAYSTATAIISIGSFAVGVLWGVSGVAAAASLSFILLQTPLIIWGLTRRGLIRLKDLLRALLPLPVAGSASALSVWLLASHPFKGGFLVAAPVAYGVFAGVGLLLPGGRSLFAALWASARRAAPHRWRSGRSEIAPRSIAGEQERSP